ncbi:hypothetical protein [Paraburkholderia caballeronis]|uniref:hypothetical protein n=1 Tax=Paraburkholderia caballeronis TaxID=416943 RepID=UPI001066D531|nr:hypothetical protein [Paraburkholderia caballeronis]TDV06070.1 hypothetical protein C7408_12451 [Paraburkholderia caballeronis]TDV09610.1 hypothetical protein C7406_12651 [Paraburkholderia caballeronis]TDV21675.1 hypothetical protein C7404_12151 [Paraburkholderia caballeronis]
MSDIMASAPQPVNYTGLQVQADPVGSFMKSQALQSTMNLQGAQAQDLQQSALLQSLAAQRQKNFQQQWQQFSQNPTPQGAVQMAMSWPEMAQPIQGAWGSYNEQQRQQELDQISPVYSTLINKRPDVAENLVQQHIDAIQNTSGYQNDPQLQQQLTGAKRLLSLIQQDQQNGTNNAQAYLGGTLAAAMGPQDFMAHFGQGATMPASVAAANVAPAQAQAALAQTQAQAAQTQAEAGQTQARTAAIANDANMAVQNWIRNYNFPQLSPEQNNQLNGLAMNAATANNRANQFDNLTQALNGLISGNEWKSGISGSVAGKLQQVFGTQDPLSVVRNGLQAVTSSPEYAMLLANGDPNAKTLAQGIPANADAQYIKTSLQAMSNLSRIQARMNDVSAQWMSVNGGSLGIATRDFTIGNTKVAAGTPFSAVLMKAVEPGSKFPSAYQAPSGTAGLSNAGPTFSGNLSYLNKYTSGGQ